MNFHVLALILISWYTIHDFFIYLDHVPRNEKFNNVSVLDLIY